MNKVSDASEANVKDLGTVIENLRTNMVMEEGPNEANTCRDEDVIEERPIPEGYGKRDLTIKHLHHGYIVEVDCHRFAFETLDRMMKYVGEYLKDPSTTEKKWWNKELF
jgi:hypothetical protein